LIIKRVKIAFNQQKSIYFIYITKNIKIIFTSHDTQFAFRTFNYNCIDYLKKPISNDRFKKAISKLNNLSQKNNGNHIYVKSKLKKKKIYLTNIKWIEALGDYIRLITNSENIVMLSSLKSFEQELPKDKFMRIHKSYIVNLEKIETYDSKNVFIDSKKIPLSRNKKVDLESALTLKSS
jgi:DNA-binding LytR/AlgR family response regulator